MRRTRTITKTVIRCAHAECANTLVIGHDDPAPKDWLCPVCEDRVREQWVIAMADAAGHTPNPLLDDLTFKKGDRVITLTTSLPDIQFKNI